MVQSQTNLSPGPSPKRELNASSIVREKGEPPFPCRKGGLGGLGPPHTQSPLYAQQLHLELLVGGQGRGVAAVSHLAVGHHVHPVGQGQRQRHVVLHQ